MFFSLNIAPNNVPKWIGLVGIVQLIPWNGQNLNIFQSSSPTSMKVILGWHHLANQFSPIPKLSVPLWEKKHKKMILTQANIFWSQTTSLSLCIYIIIYICIYISCMVLRLVFKAKDLPASGVCDASTTWEPHCGPSPGSQQERLETWPGESQLWPFPTKLLN